MSSDHRVADNFNITLRNIDAITEHTVSNQSASLFFSFSCVQNIRDERFEYLFEDFNHRRNNGCKWLNYCNTMCCCWHSHVILKCSNKSRKRKWSGVYFHMGGKDHFLKSKEDFCQTQL